MYYLKKKKKKKKKVILPHCQVVSRQCDENLSCAVFLCGFCEYKYDSVVGK